MAEEQTKKEEFNRQLRSATDAAKFYAGKRWKVFGRWTSTDRHHPARNMLELNIVIVPTPVEHDQFEAAARRTLYIPEATSEFYRDFDRFKVGDEFVLRYIGNGKTDRPIDGDFLAPDGPHYQEWMKDWGGGY